VEARLVGRDAEDGGHVGGAQRPGGLLLDPAGNAAGASYRAAITPAALQGRVASATSFLAMATLPLAPVVGGLLLEHAGGPAATVGLLVAAVLTALVPTLSRELRRVPRPADWPAAEEPAGAQPRRRAASASASRE
jgi:MFS family permease